MLRKPTDHSFLNRNKFSTNGRVVSVFSKDFFYFLNKWVSCLIDHRWLARLGGNCGRRLRRRRASVVTVMSGGQGPLGSRSLFIANGLNT